MLTVLTMTTKQEILLAARDIFLEEGIERLSMRQVARRVGISATAIYRHYSDKQQLLEAVMKEGFELLGKYLFRALEGKNARERLLMTANQYLCFAFENSEYYRVIFMSRVTSNLCVTFCKRKSRSDKSKNFESSPTFKFLSDRLEDCAREHLLSPDDDVFQLSILVWSQCHGLASLFLSGGGKDVMTMDEYAALSGKMLTRMTEGILR
jgi:AcrR family transcriptional regulator